MATSSPSPIPTGVSRQTNDLPLIIAASAGGGALLLATSVIIAYLLIRRRNRKQELKKAENRVKELSPRIGETRKPNAASGKPATTTTTVPTRPRPTPRPRSEPFPTRMPSSERRIETNSSRAGERAAAVQMGRSQNRPVYSIHYSAGSLTNAMEAVERGASPAQSFVSDGVVSNVSTARASSDLNHGRSVRSLEQQQQPPSSLPQPERPRVKPSTLTPRPDPRPPPTCVRVRQGDHQKGEIPPIVRRTSDGRRRAELLRALELPASVAVAPRAYTPRPSTSDSNGAAKVRQDRYPT